MILDLKGIYKDYQQGKMTVPVLKDVDFSMEEGEYVAIMGPSGSGKTTLMNIIGCLDKPTKGTFLLNGEDIAKCTENEMSDIRCVISGHLLCFTVRRFSGRHFFGNFLCRIFKISFCICKGTEK